MRQGLRSRGYLPHIELEGREQFVTFRLADSVPAAVIEKWSVELDVERAPDRRRLLLSRIEAYLDKGHGSAVLKNPVAANIVQEALFYAHTRKCKLLAWAIMPNHVHTVLVPDKGESVGSTIGPLKSFTAMAIHRKLGLDPGRLWQPEFYDRLVRDDEHRARLIKYIEWNPVKARLCTDPKRWPYSTANDVVRRRLADAPREMARS